MDILIKQEWLLSDETLKSVFGIPVKLLYVDVILKDTHNLKPPVYIRSYEYTDLEYNLI